MTLEIGKVQFSLRSIDYWRVDYNYQDAPNLWWNGWILLGFNKRPRNKTLLRELSEKLWKMLYKKGLFDKNYRHKFIDSEYLNDNW